MYRLIFFLILSFIISVSSSKFSFATDTEFTSSTYLQMREDVEGNDYAPLYEFIDLELKNIKEGRLSFHTSGWLRYDLQDKAEEYSVEDKDREVDELTYAYLTYNPLGDRGLIFDAGRHFVFSGIASEHIDGISTRWEIIPTTGLSLFSGIPVETEGDGRGDDFIYGGRLYQRVRGIAEVGVSYLKEDNDSSSFREEVGIDLWCRPSGWFEVQGQSFLNEITEDWMEHSYNIRIFPSKRLILSGLYSYTSYDDAFSARTLNIFSPDFLGKGEELTKVGGSAEYNFNDSNSLTVDYANYEYNDSGSADYYGAKFMTDISGVSLGASLHRMDTNPERDRYLESYLESRIFAAKDFDRLKVSLDAIQLHYDEALNDIIDAYWVNGAIGYRFTESLMVASNIDYSKNPDFDYEVRAFFKLIYNLSKEGL